MSSGNQSAKKCHALLPTAGAGSRLGGDLPKQFQELAGRPMLAYAIVRNTLAAQLKSGIAVDDWILVHDAARPGITPALIERLVTSVRNSDVGGLLAVRLADTLKQADLDLAIAGNMPRVLKTIPREHLWQAQTPQMFGLKQLHIALEDAIRLEADVTDEASAMELTGVKPLLIEGATRNFKVTHPADWDLMQLLLNSDAR